MGELLERDRFLVAMAGRLDEVAARRTGEVVLVAGEAGIGKTSLLKALAKARPEVDLWWGGCDALQTPHPLAPLHDIALDAPARFPSLHAPGAPRTRLFAEVFEALRGSAAGTLAVFEDVHWADDATLDLLRFLGRRIERLAALLVLSFRDDEVAAAHPLRRVIGELPAGRVTRLDLPGLSEEAVEALARSALRSPTGLHAATRGNPFFVTELLTHGGEEVPRSVRDVVLARFGRLAPAARSVVRTASIVPSRIEKWLAERTCAPALGDVEACLDSGLLQADATHFFFRHELARAAIEGALPAATAQALHAKVLEALRERPPGSIPAARFAHHAARAGDEAAILLHAPEAAQEAAARGAHREAAAHYGAALRCAGAASHARRGEWLQAFAIECRATARHGEAIAALRELEALLRARGDRRGEGDCLAQLALVLVVALRNAEADAASLRAIELLEALPPGVELARAWQVQAQLRMLNRDCAEAVEWGRRAIDLASRLGDRPVLAAAHGSLGAALVFLDYAAGCAQMRRAIEIATGEGLDYVVANNLTNLGSAAGELQRWDDAERHLRDAIAYATAREVDFYRDYATAWLALCDLARGRWDEAAIHAAESAERSDASSTARIMALVALGRLRTRRGEAGAEAVLDEALRLAELTGTLQRVAPVRCARAEAAWTAGDPRRAAAEARAALDLAVRHGHAWHAGEIAYWLWRCGEPVADVPTSEPYALEIAGRWREAAQAWAALGCVFERARALERGEDEAPIEALAAFEALGARPAADALRRRLRAAGVRGVPRGARASTRENAYGLTEREAEVLALLCEGLRNAEIAARLVRSVRTIDHHIAAILAKLGVASRLEAIEAARAGGLHPRSGRPGAAI